MVSAHAIGLQVQHLLLEHVFHLSTRTIKLLVEPAGIEPLAISGLISMSPLGMIETEAATGIPCVSAKNLQRGKLNNRLLRSESAPPCPVSAADILTNPEESAVA